MELAASGFATQKSRLYPFARSGFAVIVAAFLELAELLVLGLIADMRIGMEFGRAPFIAHGLSQLELLLALAATGYLLVGAELLIRHRSARRSLTLPLVLLPLGRMARNLFMLALAALVIVPKLLVYFLFLTIAMPLMSIASLFMSQSFLALIDGFDALIEPVEHNLNRLFNLLYFNKINPIGGAFSTGFNLSLTSWCLNH